MSHSASLAFPTTASVTSIAQPRAAGSRPSANLASAKLHQRVRVVELQLDDETSSWLRAVGICEGESIMTLRRAAFGGPLHVRTGSGGEFALHLGLADSILVEGCPDRAE